MRNFFALGAALLLIGSGLLGCGNKEPETVAPPNVPQAGGKQANTGSGTTGGSTAAADFTSDTGTTAAVKKALEENADVKDVAAKITIETKDKRITLKGEVPDTDTKRKVGDAVTAALKANNAPADIKVNNALVAHKH